MTHAHHINDVTAAGMPRVDARAVAGIPAWDSLDMSFDGDLRFIRVVLK